MALSLPEKIKLKKVILEGKNKIETDKSLSLKEKIALKKAIFEAAHKLGFGSTKESCEEYFMERSELEKVLEECEFFKGLKKDDITKIAELCEIKECEVGEFIFRQHDFGEHIYIIADGVIHLERNIDLGTRKGSVIIDSLGKGRVLGCWSTLLGEPHFLMSSASCQKPTQIICIRGEKLREIMRGNTGLGFHIMERFCFLLRERIQAAYGALEKV